MEEVQIKVLMLTKAEALYLDDVFTVLTLPDKEFGVPLGMRPVGQSALLAVPPSLIDKIGMVVLLTTTENGVTEAPLEVDETELYFIREVANTQAKFLDESVGFNLKRKIYYALLEDDFKESLQFAKIMEDLETSSSDARKQAQTNLEPKA